MANAARDPVFFAALAVANQDKPGVGTYCLRCHSPTAFVSGHATPPDGSAFDDVDKQGIGCETCHRATQSTGADAPYILSDAQLVFTENTDKHGPYEDTNSPAHGSVVEDSSPTRASAASAIRSPTPTSTSRMPRARTQASSSPSIPPTKSGKAATSASRVRRPARTATCPRRLA